MGSGGVQTGHHSIVRENFALDSSGVVAISSGAAAVILAGPTRSGTVLIVKAFSRIVNVSGADRNVTLYMVPTGGTPADGNSIGKALSLPANQWLPFGEHYLPYGYSLYAIASGSGVQVVFSHLLED